MDWSRFWHEVAVWIDHHKRSNSLAHRKHHRHHHHKKHHLVYITVDLKEGTPCN